MALSVFDDKALPPDDSALATMLGRTSSLWTRLKRDLHANYDPLIEQWNYAGKAYGWSLRLKQPKRVFVYLTPCRSHFLASFVLGDKACEAARASGLPTSVLTLLDQAPRHAEGRGFRLPVRTAGDANIARALAAIKAAP